MKQIPVLHIVDTLSMGGAEHVAVNLANALLDSPFTPHLCVTRQLGPVRERIAPRVGFLHLDRRSRFDVLVLRKYIEYVRANHIRLIHAHSTSVFFALTMARFLPDVPVLWHVHGVNIHGMSLTKRYSYRWASRRARCIACVSRELVQWVAGLKASDASVWYLPNFNFSTNNMAAHRAHQAAGCSNGRVICVSNLKNPKDHFTLLKAWTLVIRNYPGAHLVLVGGESERAYARQVFNFVEQAGIEEHVTFLGQRSDVQALLGEYQIGVLSSRSEGFPVTLLEYGTARLGVVATDVGQCKEILDYGRAGLLVPPGDIDALAGALLRLLRDPALQQDLGSRLHKHVSRSYARDAVLRQLFNIYTESTKE